MRIEYQLPGGVKFSFMAHLVERREPQPSIIVQQLGAFVGGEVPDPHAEDFWVHPPDHD